MLLIDNDHQVNGDEIYIEMLGVDPAWRGQGVARHLIIHAETIACGQGLNQVALAVVSDNTPAIPLYEKMGFTISAERRSRLLKWITGHSGYCEMVKQLSIVNS